MNKSELVDAIAAETGLSKAKAGDALDSAVNTVQREVAKGGRVTLPGFGTFERRRRKARTGRNPQTGATIKVKATKVPAFKPGATFKSIADGSTKPPAKKKPAKPAAKASSSRPASKAKAPAKRKPSTKKPAARKTAKKTTAKKASARKK